MQMAIRNLTFTIIPTQRSIPYVVMLKFVAYSQVVSYTLHSAFLGVIPQKHHNYF